MKKLLVAAALVAAGYFAHEIDWSDVSSPIAFEGGTSKGGVKVQVQPTQETRRRAEVIRKKMGY